MAEIKLKITGPWTGALRRFKSSVRGSVIAEVYVREKLMKSPPYVKKKSEAARKRKFK